MPYQALKQFIIGNRYLSTAQFLAADPKVSAWVAASAGTGKTKVLTDRILNLLLHGFAAERILCLTFTKAAAAEMANRLMQRLALWATATDEELGLELQTLLGNTPVSPSILQRARQLFPLVLDVPGGMKIQTIHGFCQSTLSRFPLEAGVPPHFQIIDDLLADQILNDAQRATFLNPSPFAKSSLEVLNPYMADQRFGLILKELYQNRSRIMALLAKHKTIWAYAQHLMDFLHIDAPSLCEDNILADNLIDELKCQFVPKDTNYDSYVSSFLTKKNEIRKKLSPEQLQEAEKVYQFVRSLALIETIRSTIAILILFQEIMQCYHDRKIQSNVLDYDDLIDKTRKLLSLPDIASWVLYKLDGGIDHLLIDEAQDTNEAQWEIILRLTSEFYSQSDSKRTIFAVGDAKQSIYSFQGANPKDFIRFKDHFAQLTKNVGQNWRDVQLDLSYRSTEPILTVVDEIFSQYPTKQGLTFDQTEIVHDVYREMSDGVVELWPLIETDRQEEEVENGEWKMPLERIERPTSPYLLAQYLADQVASWLQSSDILPSTNQPIQPRDILILVRKRTELTHEIIRALKKSGIPVAGSDRLVLTDYIAIQDLLAVGQFALLPEDDLNLACVLRSPLIGMSEEDLYTLAQGRQGSLWLSLVEQAKTHLTFLPAYDWLKKCMNQADVIPVYEFYNHVLTQGEGRLRFVSRLGQEVEEVLEEFLTQCIKYDQGNASSLQGFIHFMSNQSQEIKRDSSDTNSNQIRMMTIHGAKGLQAPIVILPDAAEGGRDKRELFLWGDNVMMLRPKQEDDTLETSQLKKESARQVEEEKRRLFYVALTRAQDRLYVGGWKTEKEIPEDCWYQLMQKAIAKRSENNSDYHGYLQGDYKQPIVCKEAPVKKHALPIWVRERPANVHQSNNQAEVKRSFSSQAIDRGIFIHQLFEYLPDFPAEQRYDVACQLIHKKKLPLMQWESDIQAVLSIMKDPNLTEIFGPNSLAEVPISGYIEGKLFQGRIDRLHVSNDKVIIVDFKTNQNPPAKDDHIPKEYIQQLEGYAKALSSLYPHHQIQKLILWTSGPYIQVIH